MTTLPLPPIVFMISLVTTEPMKTLSGAMKVCSASWPSGAIIVSMAITGVPASITFLIGSFSVPMPKVWMRHEIPFLGGEVVDRGALLGGRELAVEPGDLDIHQLAPGFGGLLALRAPCRLQAGIAQGGLERLAGRLQFLRDGRIEAGRAEQRAGQRGRADCLEDVAARPGFLDKIV